MIVDVDQPIDFDETPRRHLFALMQDRFKAAGLIRRPVEENETKEDEAEANDKNGSEFAWDSEEIGQSGGVGWFRSLSRIWVGDVVSVIGLTISHGTPERDLLWP